MSLDPMVARRRYVTVTFLFWFPIGLYIPAQVLLLLERGMSLGTAAGLFAVHSFTVAALELPTGGLSDVLGRRGVLAAAGVLYCVSLTLLALSTALWVLVVAMLLAGTGRALSSGPAEAWYVDTVQAHSGPGAELRTGLARGGTALAVALAAGTLCGGALPWLLTLEPDVGARLAGATDGLILPLSVPVLTGAAVLLVYLLYALTALPEPPRPPATLRGVLRGVPVTVRRGLRLGAHDTIIRRLLLSTGAAGAALATIELLTPGRAAAVTGASASGATLFAVLACAGFACTAVGSATAPRVAAALGGSGERAVLVTVTVSATGLLLLGVTTLADGWGSLALAAAGYALVYVGIGASNPNKKDLLHRRVDSTGRATALSFQSLAMQLVGALTGMAAAALPAGPLPWLLGSGALLAAAMLWTRPGDAAGAVTPVASPETEAGEPARQRE